MTAKFYTLLALGFIFTTTVFSQPLPGSALPDTITTKGDNSINAGNYKNKERLIYTYHSDHRKDVVSKYKWVDTLQKFVFAEDSTFLYLQNNKLSQIKTKDFVRSYYYNVAGADSLETYVRLSDSFVVDTKSYTYTVDGQLYSILTTNLYSSTEDIFDASGNRILNTITNGNAKHIHNYYYEDDKLILYTYKRGAANDTTSFEFYSKFEYFYENENLIEYKQYSFDNTINDWKLGRIFKITYSDNLTTAIYGTDLNNPEGRIAVYYNPNKQIIDQKEEKWNSTLSAFKIVFQELSTYRQDGSLDSISTYNGISQENNLNVYLTFGKKYGYRNTSSTDAIPSIKNVSATVYPNPLTSTAIVSLEDNNVITNATLYNANGIIQQQYHPKTSQFMIERNNQPSGVYYLKMETSNGLITKPIIFMQ